MNKLTGYNIEKKITLAIKDYFAASNSVQGI